MAAIIIIIIKKTAFAVWYNGDLQHNIFSPAIFLSTRDGSMKMNWKYIPQHRTALWIANFHTRKIPRILKRQFSTTFERCFSCFTSPTMIPVGMYWTWNWSTDGLVSPDVIHKNSLTVLSVGKLFLDRILTDDYIWAETFVLLWKWWTLVMIIYTDIWWFQWDFLTVRVIGRTFCCLSDIWVTFSESQIILPMSSFEFDCSSVAVLQGSCGAVELWIFGVVKLWSSATVWL